MAQTKAQKKRAIEGKKKGDFVKLNSGLQKGKVGVITGIRKSSIPNSKLVFIETKYTDGSNGMGLPSAYSSHKPTQKEKELLKIYRKLHKVKGY